MPPTKDTLRQEFANLFSQVIERKMGAESTASKKALAEAIGAHYQTFIRWPRGKRPIHAHKLALLCKALDDMSLLDWLESQAGRVAYALPEIKEHADIEDVKAIQKLVKEVGEALQALADTLEDHIVEDWELKKTLPELDDVIRECARLKHWLTERSRADRAKGKTAGSGRV